METLAQREERIRQLEDRRVQRRAQEPNPMGVPEGIDRGGAPGRVGPNRAPAYVGPGRGDLNYTSMTWGSNIFAVPSVLSLIGGRTISFADIFMTQPWVAVAVRRMLTWALRVPLKVYTYGSDPNDRDQTTDHPVHDMIMHPWDRASQADLIQGLLGPMLVNGNSLTIMNLGRSGRIVLDCKDWRYVEPIMPWRDSLEGFRCDVDDEAYARDYSIDKCLFIREWSPDGPIGISPLQQLGTTIAIEDAGQRYQLATFQQGARPPSAVTASEAFLGIKPEERRQIMAQLRRDITELYGGPENSGKPALLPPGLDWKPLGMSTVEAALVDQRKIAREEIASVYLIPPPMMGILDRATYSNIATQREMVYTDSLGPPLILIERALNTQLIRDLLALDDVFVEFDFAEVLRGDRLDQINSLRSAIGTGLMSPNEGRVQMGMPKIDSSLMNDYYIPTNNLTPISTLSADDLKPKNRGAPSGPTGAAQRPPRPPGQTATPDQVGGAYRALHVVQEGREYVLTPA